MLVEKKHKVHMASKVKEVTKLTARANYQMIIQGSYFNFVLNSYKDQGKKEIG
jgi:hypothetical protein